MRVATVTPLYKEDLTADERVSLLHLRRILEPYDRIFVAPQSLAAPEISEEVRRFPDRFFQSTLSYNKLLLSRQFYEAFSDYDYILIYQLDCLVLAPELDIWCSRGWDYIGAPWFPDFGDGSCGEPFWAVGNGGLSLRRVEACLRVLSSPKRITTAAEYWQRHYVRRSIAGKAAGLPKLLLKSVGVANSVGWYT
nr:hypothetical protein [Betaproteobacteria bacterium]